MGHKNSSKIGFHRNRGVFVSTFRRGGPGVKCSGSLFGGISSHFSIIVLGNFLLYHNIMVPTSVPLKSIPLSRKCSNLVTDLLQKFATCCCVHRCVFRLNCVPIGRLTRVYSKRIQNEETNYNISHQSKRHVYVSSPSKYLIKISVDLSQLKPT